MAPPFLAGFKHLNLGRRLVLLLCTVLLLAPSALGGDHAQECTTYKDCHDREDCFKGRCVCSGLWGTYGPKCSTPSWTTYLLAVHVVVVFLLYRRAAALHWMSLRDHLAGKPEEGWAEAVARCFCLKVAFNVTSLLAFLCMMGQRALFFTYCFSWLSVHKYRNRINGPTFILTRAWAGFLALSLLSFAWIWSSVAAQRNRKKRRQIRRQRPTSSEQTNSRSRSTSSGTGVSGSQNPAGYSNGPRRVECPCSSAALQLCGVCGVMQLVGWYGVTVLATAQLWLQTMSFVFIELMALFYFILGSYSVLGFRKLVKLLVMPCCCCGGGGALSSAELLGILMHSPKANGGEPEQQPPTNPPESLSNITPENSAMVVDTRRIIPETSTERPTPPAVITEPTKPEGPADNNVNMFRGNTEDELVEAGLKAGGHRHKKGGSGRAHHRHRNKRRRDSTEETIRRLAEQQANLEDVSSRTLSLSWRRDHRSRASHSHTTPHTKSTNGKGFFAEVEEADLPKTEHLPEVQLEVQLEVEADVKADVDRPLSDDIQPDLQKDPRRERMERNQSLGLEREGSSEGASSMGRGGGERPSNSNTNSNVSFNMGGGASASDNMSAVNGNPDRPSLVGGEELGRLSPPTVAMLSLQEKVERSFREVLDVARVWIYCFAFSSAFMLIFAVTEQDPALGVLGSCCFSYSMVAELVVNLHCLRYVSRVVRPHLRICCGDYESVGEEDRRRRLLVRIMRLEKIRPHPSSEDNDAGIVKE